MFPGSGCQYSYSPNIPPIDEINPPEPEFTLKPAIWRLKPIELSELPLTSLSGYAAEVINLSSNKLCLNYVTKAINKNMYSLKSSNASTTIDGKKLYKMKNSNSSSLYYSFNLQSDDGVTGNNFSFPSQSMKYISLNKGPSGVSGRSEMCWTPKIYLYRDASTSKGDYSDIINLVVSPKS